MSLKTLDLSGVTKTPKALEANDDLDNINDETSDLFEPLDDDEDDDDAFEEIELIEESDTNDNVDEELDEEELEEDDEEEDASDEELEEDDEEEPKERSRKSRSNERIRQLVAEKNESKAREEAKDAEAREWQEKYIELQKETVETNKTLLKQHKESIKAQLAQAHEAGDTAKLIDLQEQLSDVSSHLNAYESWQPPKLEQQPKEKPKETTQSEGITPEFEDWLLDNTWFQNPKTDEDLEKVALADAYAKLLMHKGYTMDDPEFFNLVDEKLENKVAKKKETVVESKKSSKKDVKNTKKRKKVSQTVQGASRTSATSQSGKPSRRKKTVSLSTSEKAIADQMGLTHKEYADEKYRLDNLETNGLSRMKPLKLD